MTAPHAAVSSFGLGIVAAFCLAPPGAPPDAGPWLDLFDGKSLQGWVIEAAVRKDGFPKWSVTAEGLLRAEAGRNGFGFLRYERRRFEDFVLDVEYRFQPAAIAQFNGNSGVGIRGPVFDPLRSGVTRPSYASYEIQLLDDAGKPPTKHSTASLYRYVAPSENAAKPAPEWNHLQITCAGPRIEVVLNDKRVIAADQSRVDDLPEKGRPQGIPAPKDKPLSGYLLLQSHSGTVEFRTVRIRELTPTGP